MSAFLWKSVKKGEKSAGRYILLSEDRRLFCKVGVLSSANVAAMLTVPQRRETLGWFVWKYTDWQFPRRMEGERNRGIVGWMKAPSTLRLCPWARFFTHGSLGCVQPLLLLSFCAFRPSISATAPALLSQVIQPNCILNGEAHGHIRSRTASLALAVQKRWPLCGLILPRHLHQPTFPPPQCHLCSLTKWHTQTPPISPHPSIHPSIARSLSLLLRRWLYGRQAWQFCQNHSKTYCVFEGEVARYVFLC